MKSVVLTFDDGRTDNYSVAYPIMKKYGLCGTLFITTGYIDGTFKSDSWLSAGGPMTVEQIKEMKDSGFEIALHGDCHTTDVNDFGVSLKKLDSWGLSDGNRIGFSIPNSNVDEESITAIRKTFADRLLYIRGGRRCDTTRLPVKIKFGLYTYLKIKAAYRSFNKVNTVKNGDLDPETETVPSIVIRKEDRAEQIIDFLKSMPDDTVCVFMLHSILHKNDELYGKDSWCWDTDEFEKLCHKLNEKEIETITLKDYIIKRGK